MAEGSIVSDLEEVHESITNFSNAKSNDLSERNLSIMYGVDNSCQTQKTGEWETRDFHVCRESPCLCEQVSSDIKNLKACISELQSSVSSFEIILKDHDSILFMYNKAADLNEKYLKELNDRKRLITCLEQKIAKVEEERDSLQLATRLIAQDKYGHISDANRPSTKTSMQNANRSSINRVDHSVLNEWQNIPINNMANPTESNHRKSSGPSSICTGNSHEILMDESDKICSEQKQENTRVPQHVTSDTASLPLHNEVLSITNEYPLVNDMNNHKDELIIIQDSQRQDQIQNDSVRLQDLAGENEINDVNEMEPQLKTNHPKEKSCIVMIGDSIIKHIDPKKLSKNKVYKYTYPGDTAESIATKVCALKPQIAPSHVIIHAGTNNIPTETADECAQKIVNLAGKLKEKFPNSKIGLSSIIQRQDIQVATKIDEANKILKQKCMDIGMSFIDNYTLDSTCLNGSNIHLNAKGSAILATKFITFLGGNKSSKTSHYHEDFPLTTLHQLGNLLRTIGIFPVHKYQKKKRR